MNTYEKNGTVLTNRVRLDQIDSKLSSVKEMMVQGSTSTVDVNGFKSNHTDSSASDCPVTKPYISVVPYYYEMTQEAWERLQTNQ
ncbi:MAG: hypothetical protein AAF702_09265 [Chloroflexota bacterium]